MQKYDKTEWIPEVTLVSAEKLNKVEDQLENLTNESISIDSQLKHKTSNYSINLDKINKIKTTKYPKIIFWGDSVTDGSSSTPIDTKCYVRRFSDSFQIINNSLFGAGFETAIRTNGWTETLVGINERTYVGNSNSDEIQLMIGLYRSEKVDIFYQTEPDGGEFQILDNKNTVVATINCNGNHKLANKYTIQVEKGKSYKLKALGKTYFNQYCRYSNNSESDGILVHKLGHGGVAISDTFMTDETIEANLKTFNQDLTVICFALNDFSRNKIDVFEERYRKAIETCKSVGSEVLLMPHCGGKAMTDNKELWNSFLNILKDLAIEYECAFLNIDSYWGGYYNAIQMFSDDTIHLNNYGHKSIANLLQEIICPQSFDSDIFYINRTGVNRYYGEIVSDIDLINKSNSFTTKTLKSMDNEDLIIQTKNRDINIYDKNGVNKGRIRFYDDGKSEITIRNESGTVLYQLMANRTGYVDITADKGVAIKTSYSNPNHNMVAHEINTPLKANKGFRLAVDQSITPQAKGDLSFKSDGYFYGYSNKENQNAELPFQQCFKGRSSLRISNPVIGLSMFDTTLGKPIWWNGTNWVDANGTTV